MLVTFGSQRVDWKNVQPLAETLGKNEAIWLKLLSYWGENPTASMEGGESPLPFSWNPAANVLNTFV